MDHFRLSALLTKLQSCLLKRFKKVLNLLKTQMLFKHTALEITKVFLQRDELVGICEDSPWLQQFTAVDCFYA